SDVLISRLLLPLRPPQRSSLFPYTTLFRSLVPFSGCQAPVQLWYNSEFSGCQAPVQLRYNSEFFWCQAPVQLWYNSEFSWCLARSEEHTSELQSRENIVCRLLLEKKNSIKK